MSGEAGVLAQLMAQGAERGADVHTLRAIAEEAGELGAVRALARLGLADEGAVGDVRELRQLLGAWRDAKRATWRAAWGWVVRFAIAVVLTGIVARAGFGEWVR
jgi:hypothetical protein